MKLKTFLEQASFCCCFIGVIGMPGAIQFEEGWPQCILLLAIGALLALASCEVKKRRIK